uniref:Uncharacterized protein n=1 Tax=Aegilops tauschii TaxID=37682 RepID=R7W6V8_AEGTA
MRRGHGAAELAEQRQSAGRGSLRCSVGAISCRACVARALSLLVTLGLCAPLDPARYCSCYLVDKAVASYCRLPFHSYVREVAPDVSDLGGVEIDVFISDGGLLSDTFFLDDSFDGCCYLYDQAAFQACFSFGVAYEIKPKSQRVPFKDGLADTDDAQLLGPTDGELVDSTGEGLAGRTLGSTVGAIVRKDNLPQLDIVAEKAGPALIDQTPNAKRSLLLPCSDADFRLLHTFSYFYRSGASSSYAPHPYDRH